MARAADPQHRPRSGRKPQREARRSVRPPVASRTAASDDSPALQAIWHVVCTIPRGQVSTYGAVARAAGIPGRARQTGFALRVAPKALNLPWHRVVAAGGAPARGIRASISGMQCGRLRAEGVRVSEGRVEPRALTDLE